jgi:hypothetical protein
MEIQSEQHIGLKRSLNEIEEDFLCMICHNLVEDAVQTVCCGSLYCHKCIESWLSRKKTCPLCSKPHELSELQNDVRSDRNSANIIRKCKEDGCTYTGNRYHMKKHEISAHTDWKAKAEESEVAFKRLKKESDLEITQLKKDLEHFQSDNNATKTVLLKKMISLILGESSSPVELVFQKFKYEEKFFMPFVFDNQSFQLELSTYNYNISLFCSYSTVPSRDYNLKIYLARVNSLKKFRRLTLTIAKNSAAGTKIGRTI